MIYSFWEGPQPPLVAHCLASLEKHSDQFMVVTEEMMAHVFNAQEDVEEFAGLPIRFRSDLYRLLLLQETGGTWVDSDTLAVRPVTFGDVYPGADLAVVGPGKKQPNKFYGSPFYMRPGSPIAPVLVCRCRALLRAYKAGARLQYGVTSTGLISWAVKTLGHKYKIRALRSEMHHPVAWNKAEATYLGPRRTIGGNMYHLGNKLVDEVDTPPADTFLAQLLEEA